MVAELTQLEPMLTVEDVAKILRTNPRYVNKMLRDGVLTGYKVGREWRIDPDDFEDYLRRQRRPKKEGN